jgi:hypothetical protein
MEELLGSGIKIGQISNYSSYKEILGSMLCCVCMNIVLNPVECTLCETIICEDCLVIIQIAGKKCVTNKCTSKIEKANKFVREVLSNLLINCEYCNQQKILYKDFSNHLDKLCSVYKASTREKLFKGIKERDEKINELQKEMDTLKTTSQSTFGGEDYSGYSKDSLRAALLTFNLSVSQKMELYNTCVEGKLNEFKNLVVTKKYPMLEEVSAHNYFWTPLHYAMHYGQMDIIKFIFDQLKKQNKLDAALRLESNDGRCPILCLLRSNNLNLDKKKELLTNILTMHNFPLSTEAKKEAKNRDMESILKKFKQV